MEKFSPLRKASNVVFPLRDFLYILQLEEYETPRYRERLNRFFFRRNLERRDHLRWTGRAMLVGVTTVVLMLIVVWATAVTTASALGALIAIVLSLVLTPLFVALANVITLPVSDIAHRWVWARAHARIVAMPKLRIVAVAGSYGKTTTKNLISDMVRFSYRTQVVDGNINTTTGIARWISQSLQPTTELLVVEIDGYHRREFTSACAIVPPDIAVITSIGDQHLIRFGSQEAITRGIGEVFLATKPDGVRICNAATATMLREVGMEVSPRIVEAETYQGVLPESVSASVREDIAYAAAVATALDVPERFVTDAVRNFATPDRRQHAGTVFGYTGIDDSYNISNATARAGIAAARAIAQREGKKLVVLTAGIPELPRATAQKENARYGTFLAEHADAVAVLQSEFAPSLLHGVGDRIPTLTAADLPSIVPLLQQKFSASDFVLLFQPELTDASY